MHKPNPNYTYYICKNEAGNMVAAGTAYHIHSYLEPIFENENLQKFSKLGFVNAIRKATQKGFTGKVGINRKNGYGLETYLRFEEITAEKMQEILDSQEAKEKQLNELLDFIAIPFKP